MIKKPTASIIVYNWIYLAIISLIVVLTWSFGTNLIGISTILLLASIIIALQRDTLPVVPMLLMCICCTSDNTLLENQKAMPTFMILAGILIISVIIHIIRFKPKFKNGSLSLPLLLVSIALLLGGTTAQTKEQFQRGFIFAITLGFAMLAVYQVLYSTFSTQSREKIQKYMAQIMLAFSLVICTQILIYFLKHNIDLSEHIELLFNNNNNNSSIRDTLDLGWSNRAGAAYMITILLPGTFYLSQTVKKSAIIYYLLAFLQFAFVIITLSRGGILFCAFEILLMVLYVIFKGKNRTPLIILTSILIIIASTLVWIYKADVAQFVDKFFKSLFSIDTSGRTEIHAYGLQQFLSYPIFGKGLGMDPHPKFYLPPHCIYWLHSTPIQILASMGIVGVIAYSIFYYKRFKIMFKLQNPFNTIMSLGIVVFEIYSLIDSGTFIPFPMFITILIITISMEVSNKNIEKENSLINKALIPEMA